MCWSSDVKGYNKDQKHRNFQLAIFDDDLQVCQILEYKLRGNGLQIVGNDLELTNYDKMLIPRDEGTLGDLDFIRFLKKSLDFISIDLVGMNLIVLKK